MTLTDVIEATPKNVHAPWASAGIIKSAETVEEAAQLADKWNWFDFPSDVSYKGWQTERGPLAVFYQVQTLFSLN